MSGFAYKAAVLTSPGEVAVQDTRTDALRPWEALIRVRYAGICGTDLALYSGSYTAELPMVPGHEFAGEVVAVGDDRHSEWIGSFVTAEINNTCFSLENQNLCPACRAGIPTHCHHRTVMGIAGCDGAFAELVTAPVRNLHLLPDDMPLRHGVFVEPLAAAIQTFEITPISAGEAVMVLGTGRLGVLVCKVASLKGARVIAVSHSPYKLQLARRFGAHALLDATEERVKEAVLDLTGGLGADVVVECTGTAEGVATALDLARPRGTVCLKTTPGGESVPLPLTQAVVDEKQISCSRCGPFGKAIRMMTRYDLGMDALISDVSPFRDTNTALRAAQGKFEVLIEMG